MPELPDLEVVREALTGVLPGQEVARVELKRPFVVRDLVVQPPGSALVGRQVSAVRRHGKFLWLEFGEGLSLVINPKLAGRLAWREAGAKALASTILILALSSGRELHYLDAKDMGQVYIVRSPAQVPGFSTQGPDALDPSLTPALFAARLRPYRGEIKGVLRTQEFIAGIGNAYADEILFHAGISPFRKRTRLSAEEVERLYQAVREVFAWAIAELRPRVGSDIEIEVRDFLRVHRKGGQPCPRCGNAISELTARQIITSFCRHCQPGTLVRN